MRTRSSTLRDVANRAGVSVGAASKAFNNKGKLSVETRRRVLEAAADLHFVPNALIRSLQRGKTNTIGALTWEVSEFSPVDITMRLWRGISRGVAAAHRDILIYSHLPERSQTDMAAIFMDGRADGLILGWEEVNGRSLEALAAANFPTVVLYNPAAPVGLGYVDVDNRAGVATAVDYLASLGHRRIAFWAPYRTFNYVDRAEGYREGMRRNNLPVEQELCLSHENRSLTQVAEAWGDGLQQDCSHFLSLTERPTAIILGDDAGALTWMRMLQERGLWIPQDISVVGFDDVAGAIAPPGLTTIRQPAEEVGRLAARFIDALLNGASASECRATLPVELVIRGSTGPPAR
jgi:LacI family transcriptional regulator